VGRAARRPGGPRARVSGRRARRARRTLHRRASDRPPDRRPRPAALLLVGGTHPNEPIGTLTVDFLARTLCEDERLLHDLDVTLYAVPVADPDGLG
jgi:hypothetical protein